MLPGFAPSIHMAGSLPAAVTFVGTATRKTTQASSFTFSSQALSSLVPAGALLLLGITSEAPSANRNLGAVTVDGNTAAPVAASGSGRSMVGLYQYVAPADMTAATIVVNITGGNGGGCTIDMFCIVGAQSNTARGSFVSASAASTDPTTTFSPTDAGNACVAIALNNASSTCSWPTSLIEQSDYATAVIASHEVSAACADNLGTSIPITADFTSTNQARMACAYWR